MVFSKGKLKIIVSVLIVFIVIFGVSKLIKPKKTKEQVVSARMVQTAFVTKKDVPITIEAFGNLCAMSDVDVRSRITGEIETVDFQEGQKVNKGDLLFTIDEKPYQAQYQRALGVLQMDLADLNLKKDTLERNKKLYEKSLISKQDYVKYTADVESAEAKIKVDNAQIDLAKINLGYCQVTSPVGGITGKRQVDAGNIITADNGQVLVNVKTIDPIYLDFSVSESDLNRIRQAMAGATLRVEISQESGSGEVFSGDIELLENVVDTKTGTISLRAIIENEQLKLWPGTFVKVRLILGIDKDAMIVPYQAVVLGKQGYFTFVVTSDNKADLRIVETAEKLDDYIVIKSGVSVGEKVVTSGQLGLSKGVLVREVNQE